MEAAAQDEHLLAYCELKVRKFTYVPLPDKILDILDKYSPDDMKDDLRNIYALNKDLAGQLILEITTGLEAEDRLGTEPHAY
jgi:hypothetical protein